MTPIVDAAIRDCRVKSRFTTEQTQRIKTIADHLLSFESVTEAQIADKIYSASRDGYLAEDIIGSVKTLYSQLPPKLPKSTRFNIKALPAVAKMTGGFVLFSMLLAIVFFAFYNSQPDPRLSHLSQQKNNPKNTYNAPIPQRSSPVLLPNNDTLFAEDFGESWPFTVPLVAIRCIQTSGGGKAIIVEHDGIKCGLNGTAQSVFSDLAPLELIWRENPKIPGARIPITPVIEHGLRLCH